MLVCARNGYHSNVSYKWTSSGREPPCGTTPLLYSSVPGVDTPDVTAEDHTSSVHLCTWGWHSWCDSCTAAQCEVPCLWYVIAHITPCGFVNYFSDSGDGPSVEEISSGDNQRLILACSHAATGVVTEGVHYYGVFNTLCHMCALVNSVVEEDLAHVVGETRDHSREESLLCDRECVHVCIGEQCVEEDLAHVAGETQDHSREESLLCDRKCVHVCIGEQCGGRGLGSCGGRDSGP